MRDNALQLQCIELYGGVVRGFLLQPLVCMYVCIFQDSSNTQAVACRLPYAVLLFLFLFCCEA